MEITQEELDRLSFQERTVLFLTNAAYNVLQYARAEYVQAKVDVAFAAEDGLTVYSYDQGHEVIRYLVRPDGTPMPAEGLEEDEDDPESLFADAGKEDVNRVFRKWEEEESETDPRTMLSNVEYIGQTETGTRRMPRPSAMPEASPTRRSSSTCSAP